MKSNPNVPYCRWGPRHWFTYYGRPGTSAPTCRRCGTENPNYDPNRDPERHER
ncbi:hypothetical protein SEA_NAMAGO_5 [Microbacterium phage Namago]|nr:hypothetical protein SEA_NAMAGO_5 [Microbacterium phage Namago]